MKHGRRDDALWLTGDAPPLVHKPACVLLPCENLPKVLLVSFALFVWTSPKECVFIRENIANTKFQVKLIKTVFKEVLSCFSAIARAARGSVSENDTLIVLNQHYRSFEPAGRSGEWRLAQRESASEPLPSLIALPKRYNRAVRPLMVSRSSPYLGADRKDRTDRTPHLLLAG